MSEAQDKETQLSAGALLKHLREQKNLSVQDIASRLNLEARIIEAIEDNNSELLPAATYIRGYLRSYSKTLGADPEAIVASYNDGAPEPPEIIPEIKHAIQTSSSDKPVRAFTYLVSLTLVILLAAWLYSNFINEIESAGSTDTVKPAIDRAPGLSYEYPVIEHSPLPFYRDIEATEEVTPVTTDIESDSGTEADPEIVIDDDISIDADNDGEYPKLVTSDIEGPDSLILRVTTDSWIEIYDSFENKVFVNLGREGQVLDLRGTAPFTIVLGFAEGVSIEFNGETFDAAPYTRGSIARFSLDR